MPSPSYQDLITLSSSAGGLTPESIEERILSILGMLASGTAPDGTIIEPSVAEAASNIYIPQVVGLQYVNPLAKAVRTGGNVLNTLYLHPFFSGPTPITINQLDCTVTTIGAAGSVTRMGLYLINNQTNPWNFVASVTNWATLLLDAGTVATDGTTGFKPIAISQVIPANTWFAVAGVDQVALATRSLGNSSTTSFSPWGCSLGTGSYGSANCLSLSLTGVTGALPASFVPTAQTTIDGGVGIRRGA